MGSRRDSQEGQGEPGRSIRADQFHLWSMRDKDVNDLTNAINQLKLLLGMTENTAGSIEKAIGSVDKYLDDVDFPWFLREAIHNENLD